MRKRIGNCWPRTIPTKRLVSTALSSGVFCTKTTSIEPSMLPAWSTITRYKTSRLTLIFPVSQSMA
ncbi:hypothetical protein D3C83_239020 [compost metagenome]